MEAVDEFEAERDQQRHAEEQERQPRRHWNVGRFDVLIKAVGGVEQAAGQQHQEDQNSDRALFGDRALVCCSLPAATGAPFNATSDIVFPRCGWLFAGTLTPLLLQCT